MHQLVAGAGMSLVPMIATSGYHSHKAGTNDVCYSNTLIRTKTDSPTIHWIVDMITHKINKPKTNPVIKQNPRSIEKEKTTIDKISFIAMKTILDRTNQKLSLQFVARH
jgi:hypothetical protein